MPPAVGPTKKFAFASRVNVCKLPSVVYKELDRTTNQPTEFFCSFNVESDNFKQSLGICIF